MCFSAMLVLQARWTRRDLLSMQINSWLYHLERCTRVFSSLWPVDVPELLQSLENGGPSTS